MQEIRSTGKLEAETEERLINVLGEYTDKILDRKPEK